MGLRVQRTSPRFWGGGLFGGGGGGPCVSFALWGGGVLPPGFLAFLGGLFLFFSRLLSVVTTEGRLIRNDTAVAELSPLVVKEDGSTTLDQGISSNGSFW